MMDVRVDEPPLPTQAGRRTSAASRFFGMAELRQLVFDHLVTERVDLLSLARVSKLLRAHALRIWVRQLDLRVSAARRLLRFFRASPDLLAHIRFLRVRSDVHETDGMPSGLTSAAQLPIVHWTDLNTLLRMIADAATWANGQPFVDLTMAQSDPIEIPLQLKQRIVAFRLLNEDKGNAASRPDGFNYEVPDAEQGDGTGPEATDAASPTAAAWGSDLADAEPQSTQPTARLLDIVQAAGQGPGLSTLHLSTCSDLGADAESFADQVASLHGHSLRDLSICYAHRNPLRPALLRATYRQLEHFSCLLAPDDDADLLEIFLDRHPGLVTLEINYHSEVDALSHRQSFPRLRWVMTPDPFPTPEFAARHQDVIGNPRAVCYSSSGPPAEESELLSANLAFKKLRYDFVQSAAALRDTLEGGIQLSHLVFSCTLFDHDDERAFIEVLAAHPGESKSLTCLQIGSDLTLDQWSGVLQPLLGESDLLPNLSELILSVRMVDELRPRTRSTDLDKNERELGELLRALVPLRALKALTIHCAPDDFEKEHLVTVPGAVFPPALRYVRWGHQHYRFLSTEPTKTPSSEAKARTGQRGRLQRIPAAFRMRITEEGVWERTPRYVVSIYDHLS